MVEHSPQFSAPAAAHVYPGPLLMAVLPVKAVGDPDAGSARTMCDCTTGLPSTDTESVE
jgi:hypothetical protein